MDNQNNAMIDDFNDEDKIDTTANFHDFKTKNTIFGILDRFENIKHGESLVLNTPEGEVLVGSYTSLKDKFTPEDIGKKIKIVYKGEAKSKAGRVYMDFEIFKKPMN